MNDRPWYSLPSTSKKKKHGPTEKPHKADSTESKDGRRQAQKSNGSNDFVADRLTFTSQNLVRKTDGGASFLKEPFLVQGFSSVSKLTKTARYRSKHSIQWRGSPPDADSPPRPGAHGMRMKVVQLNPSGQRSLSKDAPRHRLQASPD